jgi:hypothetical protein
VDAMRKLVRGVVGTSVVVCVIIVFGFLGKGVLGLSGDEASLFAVPASVVAIYLYRASRKTAMQQAGADRMARILIIVLLIVAATLAVRSRGIEDETSGLDSEISSVRDDLSSTQSDLESLQEQVEAISDHR